MSTNDTAQRRRGTVTPASGGLGFFGLLSFVGALVYFWGAATSVGRVVPGDPSGAGVARLPGVRAAAGHPGLTDDQPGGAIRQPSRCGSSVPPRQTPSTADTGPATVAALWIVAPTGLSEARCHRPGGHQPRPGTDAVGDSREMPWA